MSVEVTRMQDLVYEFSPNFRGWCPDRHIGRGRPSPAPIHSPACGRARPGVGTQILVSLNFLAVIAPLLYATGVSLGPPQSWTQTLSRSLPNFGRWQTDRPCYLFESASTRGGSKGGRRGHAPPNHGWKIKTQLPRIHVGTAATINDHKTTHKHSSLAPFQTYDNTKKRSATGGLCPLTRGSAPGSRWGHSPQNPIIGSRSALAIWPPPNCTPGSAPGIYLRSKGKERKGKEVRSIYIVPFVYYVYFKALTHGSHSFACKYTMPAFSL